MSYIVIKKQGHKYPEVIEASHFNEVAKRFLIIEYVLAGRDLDTARALARAMI